MTSGRNPSNEPKVNTSTETMMAKAMRLHALAQQIPKVNSETTDKSKNIIVRKNSPDESRIESESLCAYIMTTCSNFFYNIKQKLPSYSTTGAKTIAVRKLS